MNYPTFALIILAMMTTASAARAGVDTSSNNPTAGGEGVGGGHGIVCTVNGHQTVQMLDYFESNTVNSFTIDLGAPSLTYRQKIALVSRRLRRLDPVIADYIDNETAHFQENASFVPTATLRRVHDADTEIDFNGHCRLRQFAINKLEPDLLPGEKPYMVDNAIWTAASSTTKAGLILHEILYRFVRTWERNVENSRNLRYYNELISSTAIARMSPHEYSEVLQRLDFTVGFSTNCDGILVESAERVAGAEDDLELHVWRNSRFYLHDISVPITVTSLRAEIRVHTTAEGAMIGRGIWDGTFRAPGFPYSFSTAMFSDDNVWTIGVVRQLLPPGFSATVSIAGQRLTPTPYYSNAEVGWTVSSNLQPLYLSRLFGFTTPFGSVHLDSVVGVDPTLELYPSGRIRKVTSIHHGNFAADVNGQRQDFSDSLIFPDSDNVQIRGVRGTDHHFRH